MRTIGQCLGTLVVIGLVAVPASAQRGGAGLLRQMPSIMLLGQKSVQEELKLSEDQAKKANEGTRKMFGEFAGLRGLDPEERQKKLKELNQESDKAVADILKPEQATRFQQIRLQQLGIMAFTQDPVAKELKFTAGQKDKIKAVQEETRKEITELRQAGAGLPELMKKGLEINQKAAEKVVAQMTPEQKTKWKEMTGAPFKGEIRLSLPGAGS
jgi:Spy/CpxP family protein refolding chaperone